MRLCAISCEVFARECARATAYSPHVVDLILLPFGLHNEPDELRRRIQKEIDIASDGRFEYIVLAYGLCSRGTADLEARSTPIVIPRAHDCITLLLGSRERYKEEFQQHPGTYYYSPGWVERKEGEIRQGVVDSVQERLEEERFREYVQKYGEDNAQFLIEQERLWLVNYNRAAFINTGLGNIESYREFTKRLAENRGWSYEEIPGDTRLIDKLLFGDWDETEFLIVRPGCRTIEQVNNEIISAV
ncbi:MAG: DUF1638 domain-containing protein [Armatimonadota bacterium]|nr:DUF1638 domain-containing protein [Armatimonadota bacterium]